MTTKRPTALIADDEPLLREDGRFGNFRSAGSSVE